MGNLDIRNYIMKRTDMFVPLAEGRGGVGRGDNQTPLYGPLDHIKKYISDMSDKQELTRD